MMVERWLKIVDRLELSPYWTAKASRIRTTPNVLNISVNIAKMFGQVPLTWE